MLITFETFYLWSLNEQSERSNNREIESRLNGIRQFCFDRFIFTCSWVNLFRHRWLSRWATAHEPLEINIKKHCFPKSRCAMKVVSKLFTANAFGFASSANDAHRFVGIRHPTDLLPSNERSDYYVASMGSWTLLLRLRSKTLWEHLLSISTV